jgi:hypothetical protein
MRTKEETAQILSDAHFGLDEGIDRIFRIVEEDESNPKRPVKLLEVNPLTTEAGILPIGMNADPSRMIDHPVVIIEITPEEFGRLARGLLHLPDGWKLADQLFPSAASARAAS